MKEAQPHRAFDWPVDTELAGHAPLLADLPPLPQPAPLTPPSFARAPRPIPLWPLPVIAALLPAIAVAFALAMYRNADGSFCNPFYDDCVSISRMAKYGAPNEMFRVFVLPGAVLQALTWLAATRAFATAGLPRRERSLLAVVGLLAGCALVVYASFLGTDGAAYAWLRKNGTLLYFGGTYVAMLLFVRGLQRLEARELLVVPPSRHRLLVGLLLFITGICLVHGFASLLNLHDLVVRIQNLTEWWGSLALTFAFGTIASLWRGWELALNLELGA
ncbi:hypothetical protein HHL11_29370 [Ramlibacter sp. G-1-2-2]|uniref:DUF998 domain-containing protein n=1 Tax=Ramlibacter agri TaxID=2728837 RepID=A0A848HA51_9BURK|nr:hypothetical protein [Ramlibacter agri]NML47896.1 hypothetical protein [Ramlibacter agri]